MLVPVLSPLLAGVTLSLSTPSPNVLAGEPVKIVVKWDVTSVLADCTFEDPDFSNRTLELVVDSGSGARRYSEYPRDRERLSGGCALRPGDSLVTNYVLLRGWYAEPGGPSGDSDPDKLVTPFAAPGRHSVRVAYVKRRDRSILALSNAVMFEVAAPGSADLTVLDLLRAFPHLGEGIAGGSLQRVREILQANSSSPYLRWAKVQYFEQLADELRNNSDPETGESWWRLPKAEARANRRAAAQRITAEIADGGNWGPFEEERLWLLARYARSAGDMALSESARNEINQLFPNSMAAAKVKEWEDTVREAKAFDAETNDTPPPANDTIPPVLTLSASPSSLWPPNHEMVTVNVKVTATDNVDPKPSVKLVSITCDDGCDPAVDVAGAAVDTDDRQFQLRAERTGGGSGRSYTVTYSAKDAAGNVATKAATVLVPHDQTKR